MIRLESDKNENLETMRKMLQPAPMHFIALCCYRNVNGAIKNLSLNTSTAPIFCNSMISEKIFVFVCVVNLCSVSLSLHICRTSWQDTQNYKSNHVFLVFPFRPQMFWGRVEKIFKNGQCSYLGSWKFKANIWIFQIAFSQ